jgi:hypothetical protein
VLVAYHGVTGASTYTLESSHPLLRQPDPDDGQSLVIGEPIRAALDYHWDIDWYELDLDKGQAVNVRVESILVDPLIYVDVASADDIPADDDDSGGGLLGLDAELSFRAPKRGTYLVVVQASSFGTGGYILQVGDLYAGAPTPIVAQPTATPVHTEFGNLALYESDWYPFSVRYPAAWTYGLPDEIFAMVCELGSFCASGRGATFILLEGESLFDTAAEMADSVEADLAEGVAETEIIPRESLTTTQGLPGEIVGARIPGTQLIWVRYIVVHDGIVASPTFLMYDFYYEELRPLMEAVFRTVEFDDLR